MCADSVVANEFMYCRNGEMIFLAIYGSLTLYIPRRPIELSGRGTAPVVGSRASSDGGGGS